MFGREAASCSPSFSSSYLPAHGSCLLSGDGRLRSPRASLRPRRIPAPTLAPRYQRGYFYSSPPSSFPVHPPLPGSVPQPPRCPHISRCSPSRRPQRRIPAPAPPAQRQQRQPSSSHGRRPRSQVCILDSFSRLSMRRCHLWEAEGEMGQVGGEGEIRWGWSVGRGGTAPHPAVGWGGQGGGGRGGNARGCIQINVFMYIYIYQMHVCVCIYIYL